MLQWIQTWKKFFGLTEMQRVPGLQFSRSEDLDGPVAAASLTRAKVEQLWDSSLSWKLFLTTLCHYKNKLTDWRGFIPCITLNWINSKLKLDPPWTHKFPKFNFSCTKLDHVFYLNKYGSHIYWQLSSILGCVSQLRFACACLYPYDIICYLELFML